MKKGFTLVELSIVLVIIGLLIGGILVAQSMTMTANMEKAVRDIQQIQIAITNFKTNYNCLPGDCAKATAMGIGTNGNGDGFYSGAESTILLWQHLYNSKMMDISLTNPGSYTVNGLSGEQDGINVPAFPWLQKYIRGTGRNLIAGIYIVQGDPCGGYSGWNGCETTQPAIIADWLSANTIEIGGRGFDGTSVYHTIPSSPLNSEFAQMIDGKIDDGKPLTGSVTGWIKTGVNSWGLSENNGCSDGTANTAQNYKSGYTCGLFISPAPPIE